MEEKVKAALAGARVTYSLEDFMAVGLPGVANVSIGGEGFSAVIKEKGETTIIVPSSKWAEIGAGVKNAAAEGPFTILTVELPQGIGGMRVPREILDALEAKGLSAMCVSAYSHDHFLVRKDEAKKAIEALEKLIIDCRGTKA